ncbi:amino acid/polyamine transporter I [Penicillium nucicola]|uniref:amino acid/polyamine transporter I n=1 Tax=Penicillium nucicola TaxID=1850975 RepID=UPI0025451963|nr:amino acid/polyamine transporter I [Penicillium nucicola]KAJ5775639.1 amino acid/polyamine transporter I [Penicillium nucicola]
MRRMKYADVVTRPIEVEVEADSNPNSEPQAEPPKCTADDEVLRAQGHEAALKRSFSILASLGLAFNITNSWVGLLSNFGQNLKYGGYQVALFSVLIACFVQWAITLGLSELASAFPSSGGQYHFVYIIASKNTRRFGAFVTGWMSILGWWMAACSGISLVANTILGLAQFLHPEFEIKQWHLYCVYLTILIITMMPLLLCPERIPLITILSLYLTLSGFVVWVVTILVMHKHGNSASSIIRPGTGTSGWNGGTAWLLGVINSMYSFGCTDGAIHIAEEIRLPGRRLPQIMNLTMAIGLCTAIPMITIIVVTAKDMEKVMNAGMPAIEVVYQPTGSKRVTIALSVLLTIIYASCLPPQWVTCGRLAWAFARDGGTPFPGFFTKVDEKLQFPLRTTIASTIFAALYGLIYLASTTAFNSIITSAITLLNLSYAVPQALLATRGREKCLPKRPLDLGRWGYACNIFAPLWSALMCVMVCFPPGLPVTTASMNWSAPILVALTLVILAFWFLIGENFKGPDIDWDALNIKVETRSNVEAA